MAIASGPTQINQTGVGADDPRAGATPLIYAAGIDGSGQVAGGPPINWPLDYNNFVAAPAGENRRSVMPSREQLDWAQKALHVVFLSLALLGLLSLLGSSSPRAIVRGAARKHAVQGS